jgi:GDPmannose 4,6-dehydratase
MAPEDYSSVSTVIKQCQADEIYYLAGQSSVNLSFERPHDAIRSISIGILNVLEACKLINRPVRVFNAGSSECFGNTGEIAATEDTSFSPLSPYAVAKCAAHWLVRSYRESYGLWACTGILFSHESPLRTETFVTQKIVMSSKRIAAGSAEILQIGNIDISRDWGWAPEYVEGMWKMLQQSEPKDYVIATGDTNSLRDFLEAAFEYNELDWTRHTVISENFSRPTDVKNSRADPKKIEIELGWKARYKMKDVIKGMLDTPRSDKVKLN